MHTTAGETPVSAAPHPLRWTHRLAVLLAGATLVMILVGGAVTTFEAGDSDPEWSLRFWDWFRSWSQMPGGQVYEITHRQIGTLVGFLTLVFLIVLWRTDRRWRVRYLGLLVLAGVVLQGLLGGLRVLAVSDPNVQHRLLSMTGLGDAQSARIASAIVHAGLAQVVFALMAVMTVVTSPGWDDIGRVVGTPGGNGIRRMGTLTSCAILGEMLLGAWVRHGSRGVAEHVAGALLVSVLAVVLALRVVSTLPQVLPLRRPAIALAVLAQVQIFLGISSLIIPPLFFIAPTLHVVVGGAMLAASVMLTLRAYKMLAVRESLPAFRELAR